MSAKEKQVVEVQEKLDDITECPICTETYKEPKILPCIHTFCVTCLQDSGLKTKINPGDTMPCPVCRTEFTIPEKGFTELKRNFFMERLIEMKNILNPSSAGALCDACKEDTDLDAEAEIPSADMYCADCNERLCGECCKIHRKYKATKNHRLLSLDGAQINIPLNLNPCVCDEHENKPLEIYCSSCQEAVCALCLYQSHKTHDTSPVTEVVTDFRRIIKKNSDSVMKWFLDLKQKTSGKNSNKEMFAAKVADVEIEIKRIKQNLQECTERDCDSLLEQLNSIKQGRLKEYESQQYDIETVLTSLESYQAYCSQVTSVGSEVDICRAVHNLSTRAADLKQRYKSVSLELFPNILLKKTKVHGASHQTTNNTIGKIEAEDNTRTETEIRSSISESSSFDSSASDTDSERTEESDVEDSEERTYTAMEEKLAIKVNELEQELKLMKQKEMERERIEKNLMKYTTGPTLIKSISTHMATRYTDKKVTVTGLAILDNELFVTAKQRQDIEVYDAISYVFKRLWRLSELHDPWDMCSCSRLKCLYITSGYNYEKQLRFNVSSYSLCKNFDEKPGSKFENGKILRVNQTGDLQHCWNIGGNYGTLSITGEGNVILTVPAGCKIIVYDSDGKCLFKINISTDHNLKVLLSSDQNVLDYAICPSHAKKLPNGYFVVSYFVFKTDKKIEPIGQSREAKVSLSLSGCSNISYASMSGLCMINPEGQVVTIISGNPEEGVRRKNSSFGFGKLHEPWYLAVDKDRAVIVLERSSNRISLFSPNLKYNRKVVSSYCELSNPYRMCLDETNGRLLVTNSDSVKDDVKVYQIKDP